MKPDIQTTIKDLLSRKLNVIENALNADVFTYYGQIVDGLETFILQIIEEIVNDGKKKDRLIVILTTPGGSSGVVDRYLNIMRHHYQTIDFIVPNYAYSAGTIFCMGGDNIYMDYSSVLGPIDPQVQNKEGKWVPALGYLDKVNELIEKSRNGTLTQAEFLMIKDLDLAELRLYEQAKELTIDLLKEWLVKYKFKNWSHHHTDPQKLGAVVTKEEKEARAKEIANTLSDNTVWKSHGRAINIERLQSLRLKIEDYSKDHSFRGMIRDYYDLLTDYINTNNLPIFVHTRNYI